MTNNSCIERGIANVQSEKFGGLHTGQKAGGQRGVRRSTGTGWPAGYEKREHTAAGARGDGERRAHSERHGVWRERVRLVASTGLGMRKRGAIDGARANSKLGS